MEEAETRVAEQFGPDDGVIEEARDRQRRRQARVTLALLAVAAVGFAVLWSPGGGSRAPSAPPLRPASSLTWLTGPPLGASSNLRLIASGQGAAYLVDVDRASASRLPGIPAERGETLWLLPYRGGALAIAQRVLCSSCNGRTNELQTTFAISAGGSVRRLATVALARHQEATPAYDSTASWVQTWPHRGPCTLRLVPSTRPAVRAPCGGIGAAGASGIWFGNGDVEMLVDPFTGRVLRRLTTTSALRPLPGGLALESTPQPYATGLALVNLATGVRTPLRWPSSLHFGYEVYPAPRGPLVAIEFADPAYPPSGQTVGQAADVWILDTATGRFTHVPGFPVMELIKLSGLTWTPDGRLVVVARGGGRTVLGLWRPGQGAPRLRDVPALQGYSEMVALGS